MKIKVRESKKNEARSFDYSEVEEDAKKFDFVGLLSRLSRFQKWLEDLQERVPEVETPELHWGSQGSSGFSYYINSHGYGQNGVDFNINCGTNPEQFWGTIYADDEKFHIDSIDDLTDELIEDIAKAL